MSLVSWEKVAETAADVEDQLTIWYRCQTSDYDIVIDENELASAGFYSEEEMKKMNVWPATKDFFETYILLR